MKLNLIDRQNKILELLSRTPIISTKELSDITGVSTETIRKDLETLFQENKIIKVHGGAALANPEPGVSPFDTRKDINIEQKKKIAEAAVKLINPEESIILESSTTCLELSKILLENKELLKTLIIITNSFEIASLFEGGKLCNRLFFLGGWSIANEHCTKGFHTTQLLEYWYSDKAFISAAAIEKDLNVTSFLEDDMLFQRYAMKNAQESIVLVDKTKFELSASFSVSAINDFNYTITDLDNRELIERIKDTNSTLILV